MSRALSLKDARKTPDTANVDLSSAVTHSSQMNTLQELELRENDPLSVPLNHPLLKT